MSSELRIIWSESALIIVAARIPVLSTTGRSRTRICRKPVKSEIVAFDHIQGDAASAGPIPIPGSCPLNLRWLQL